MKYPDYNEFTRKPRRILFAIIITLSVKATLSALKFKLMITNQQADSAEFAEKAVQLYLVARIHLHYQNG